MKRQSLSRTSKRGYTLPEVVTASGLVLLVMAGVASILGMAGTMALRVDLQGDADGGAVTAMGAMVSEVREAKEVEVVRPNQFRIYYPVLREDGHYDRFQTNRERYVEYAQTDELGRPDMKGTRIWRRTESDSGRALARDVKLLRVSLNSVSSLRVSVHLEKRAGGRKGETKLTERVLYLRNN